MSNNNDTAPLAEILADSMPKRGTFKSRREWRKQVIAGMTPHERGLVARLGQKTLEARRPLLARVLSAIFDWSKR